MRIHKKRLIKLVVGENSMITLKRVPEDFVVEEISTIEPQKSGNYTLFELKKKYYTTLAALKKIASKLHIPLKDIGFAGNKDKQAITSQICSIKGVSKKRIEALELDNITISVLGFSDEPVNLGDLKGNKFTLIIRDHKEKLQPTKLIFANYFDEQRFSSHNVEIGRLLLQRDFKAAVDMLHQSSQDLAQDQLPLNQLQKLGARQLRFYIHAYQSLLFNELLAEYVKEHFSEYKKIEYSQGTLLLPKLTSLPELNLPLIGFSTTTDQKISKLLKRDGLTVRSFIFKEIPLLSSEGTIRKGFVQTKIEIIDQNPLTVSFSLPPGSYATMAMKAWLELA